MKSNSVKKIFAALAVGAMILSAPVSSSASTAFHPSTSAAVAVPVISIVKDKGEDYLTWNTDLGDEDRLYIEVSTDPSFPDNDKTNYRIIYGEDGETRCYLGNYLKTGRNYIRAFVRRITNTTNYSSIYGGYSKTIQCVKEVETTNVMTEVKPGSVTLRLSNYTDVTGYEVYRAKGNSKSYTKVVKTSDMIVQDSGLEAGQMYTYKVRGYVYADGVTTTGDWTYVQVTTWGSAMNVKATPTVTKKSANVRLTWSKVAGATSYEIYRSSGQSSSVYATNYAPYKQPNYTNWQLVATKSRKAKSFTDKKVKAGVCYNYKVVAVKQGKTRKNTKSLVEELVSVRLKFENSFMLNKNSQVHNKNGTVTVNWDKVIGATGFLVEKRDNKTGKYAAYKRLAGTATSYTFPAATKGEDESYRIYAYSGDDYSSYIHVTVYVTGKVPEVTGVKASATADGQGVSISWTAVPGAAYYRVYRSRTLSYYNAHTGSYTRSGDYVYVKASGGYADWKIRGTSVVDIYTPKTNSSGKVTGILNEGPQQGVVYYYYVAAYKSNGDKMEVSEYTAKPARIMLSRTTIAAPKKVTAKAAGKGKVTVSWKKVAGANEYCIYRSRKKSGSYELVSRVSAKKSKVTLKNQSSGKYYYIVKAVKANEVGAEQFSKAKVSKRITVK